MSHVSEKCADARYSNVSNPTHVGTILARNSPDACTSFFFVVQRLMATVQTETVPTRSSHLNVSSHIIDNF